MPIDLTRARATVTEKVYRDRVSIRRNPPTGDATDLDDTTGEPTSSTTTKVDLALDVPASARETDRLEREDGKKVEKSWTIGLDYYLAPDDLKLGDEITFDVTEDPELLGRTLFVSRVISGTNRVSRRVEATRSFDGISKH